MADKKLVSVGAAGLAVLVALGIGYRLLKKEKIGATAPSVGPAHPPSDKLETKEDAIIGGIEAGGTHFVVTYSRASDPTKWLGREEYPTTKPEETCGNVLKHLKEWKVQALGIASFGPLDLEPGSQTFGFITSTPKPHWGNFDLLGFFSKGLPGIPIQIQTDVNAAAQSEMIYGKHGNGKQLNAVCYITVGTGVGCGITIFGKILKGFAHSESGHIKVPRHPKDHAFAGSCPFHQDCVEGLVSAGAIAARLGISPPQLKDLPDDHAVWDIVGFYLAQLCISLTLIASPEVIVVGGGVLKRLVIYEHLRKHFDEILKGYVVTPPTLEYLVRSRFDDYAGAVGCLELGRRAWNASR